MKMQILDRIRQIGTPEAAPAQKPGRHSTVGLVDRLTKELAQLRESHSKEIQGYKDALQLAGRDLMEARGRSDHHLHLLKQADAEVKRLRAILDQDAQVPGTEPQPAFADRPDFQPLPDAPEPERDQEQLPPIALTLPRPETYDPVDVTAETQPVPTIALDQTQAVDVTTLREAMGMGRTAVIPVVPVAPPAQIPAGPGSTDPTEISQATGKRAVINVAQHLGEAS